MQMYQFTLTGAEWRAVREALHLAVKEWASDSNSADTPVWASSERHCDAIKALDKLMKPTLIEKEEQNDRDIKDILLDIPL